MKSGLILLLLSMSVLNAGEYLVKVKSLDNSTLSAFVKDHGGKVEIVSREGNLIQWTGRNSDTWAFNSDDSVIYSTPNKELHLLLNPSLEENKAAFLKDSINWGDTPVGTDNAYPDNPEFISPTVAKTGLDPLVEKAWGLFQIDAVSKFETHSQGEGIVVAVIDTGVDYTHEDLINNLWKNSKEIPNNKIDDDRNGYVDDVLGWDFASNDNKPYDLSIKLDVLIKKGGNPGHGTHCAGVVGASLNNTLGSAGVAPKVKIMSIRFLDEKGGGKIAAGVKSIDYAVANGAKIISASWGGDGDEEKDIPLKEAIQRANKKGVLFITAAGNGRRNATSGKMEGVDNDTDPDAETPASLDVANIITVSAIDKSEKLAVFSNYGKKRVHIGAPGVKVLSTVPGGRYQDTIATSGTKSITWDGTSMATPHVAGAAAVIWSDDPSLSVLEVKEKLLSLATFTSALKSKVQTDGRLDLKQLR